MSEYFLHLGEYSNWKGVLYQNQVNKGYRSKSAACVRDKEAPYTLPMHHFSVTVALTRIVTTTKFQFLLCSFPFLQQYQIHSISAHSRPYRHVINLPTRVIRTAAWTINNYHYLRPWLILAVVNRSTIQQLPPASVFKFYFLSRECI